MIFPTLDQIATHVVVTVSPQDTLGVAVQRMLDHDIRDIVVESLGDEEYGILTISDLIRRYPLGIDFDRRLADAGYDTLPCALQTENILEAFPILQEHGDYLGTLYTETAVRTGLTAAQDVRALLTSSHRSRKALPCPSSTVS